MAKAKFDIKTVQTEAQKSAQRAFHAGVGVTDLAVEVVRDYTAGAQKRIVSLQKSVSTIEPKALRTQAAKDAKARRVAIEPRATAVDDSRGREHHVALADEQGMALVAERHAVIQSS